MKHWQEPNSSNLQINVEKEDWKDIFEALNYAPQWQCVKQSIEMRDALVTFAFTNQLRSTLPQAEVVIEHGFNNLIPKTVVILDPHTVKSMPGKVVDMEVAFDHDKRINYFRFVVKDEVMNEALKDA